MLQCIVQYTRFGMQHHARLNTMAHSLSTRHKPPSQGVKALHKNMAVVARTQTAGNDPHLLAISATDHRSSPPATEAGRCSSQHAAALTRPSPHTCRFNPHSGAIFLVQQCATRTNSATNSCQSKVCAFLAALIRWNERLHTRGPPARVENGVPLATSRHSC